MLNTFMMNRLDLSEKKMEIGNQLANIGKDLEMLDELSKVDELSNEMLTRYIWLMESKLKKVIDKVYEI